MSVVVTSFREPTGILAYLDWSRQLRLWGTSLLKQLAVSYAGKYGNGTRAQNFTGSGGVVKGVETGLRELEFVNY